MAYRNLKDFINCLKRENELVEINHPVSPYLEITEITDRICKTGGPALLFTNPVNYNMPVLMNAYGSERRMALALGVDHVDEISERIRSLVQMKPPGSLREKIQALFQLKEIAGYSPKKN